MIEFIPIQTTCSGGDNPILNRKQIIESKEISCYINAPSDKPKTSQSVKKKKRLEQYLKTATNKAAFTQINKVFTLSQQQAESLSYDNQDNLTFEDKETVRKLVNFIWDNNTKAPTKRLRKKLSIIKATYK
jgi:maltodextrin utilization protein YvdJ